jgi:fibronectin type 3 domain-containing protein
MTLYLGRFIAAMALCLIMAGCAQTGVPLPPSLELPKPPTDLRATRKGNHVTLSWSEPTVTTDRQNVRYVGPTLVCRSLELQMSECGTPVATLPAASAFEPKRRSTKTAPKKSTTPSPVPQIYIDTLPAAVEQEDPAAEVAYAVEVQNRNGRYAGLSNRVHVPAIITLPPPNDVTSNLTDDGVMLAWTSAGKPRGISTGSDAIEYRYRIYRRDETTNKDAMAGEMPVGEPGQAQFTDSTLEWEKTYLYRITTVSVIERPDGELQVEGDDSAPVRVIAHDTFPPAVPTGLQAAYSGEGQKPFIDLIWAPVTTSDLAGYNVYRSESGGKPVKLNSNLTKAPSYRDSQVSSGKTYAYSVSAVDVRGNESLPSEPASESVP